MPGLKFTYHLLLRTSLQLCAKLGLSQARLLGICQLGALRCMGRGFTLTSDSECNWPDKTSTSCEDCKPGTVCEGESIYYIYYNFSFMFLIFTVIFICDIVQYCTILY